ncbi:undecaprenyl-diphosphatase, partial [Bacillus sp. SY8(2021)]|nr:undecaprenyl-diphosphatase [Bacillus arachidis]
IGIISALFSYWLTPKITFIKQLLNLYEKIEQNVIPSKNKSKNF